MALIQCPECGRKVSDKAAACPDCGYPIAKASVTKPTYIKIGKLYLGNSYLSDALLKVKVYQENTLLGEGKKGEVLSFDITEPTNIHIEVPGNIVWRNVYDGTIYPGKRYELTIVPSILKPKWTLNEIDVIDSGL